MPGIVVGVDGSGHSHTALEWAAKEAAVHQVPLTVLTVHQAVAGFYGSPVSYPGDDAQMQRAREAVGAETDKVLAALGDGRPASAAAATGVAAANAHPSTIIAAPRVRTGIELPPGI